MANTYKFYDGLNTDIIVDLGIEFNKMYDVSLNCGVGIEGIYFGIVDGTYGIGFNRPSGASGECYTELVYSFDEGCWKSTGFQTFTAEGISASYIKKSDGTAADDCIIEWLSAVTYVISQIDPPTTTTYTVTFNVQGHGTAPSSQTIVSGYTVSQPTTPTATGYRFDGWYKESSCINKYNFSSAVTSNLTLYAKWTQVGIFLRKNYQWYRIDTYKAYKRQNGSWKQIT